MTSTVAGMLAVAAVLAALAQTAQSASWSLFGIIVDVTWNLSTVLALVSAFLAVSKTWTQDRQRLAAVEIAIKEDRAATEEVKRALKSLREEVITEGISISVSNAQALLAMEKTVGDIKHIVERLPCEVKPADPM